jgi:hypothetical protein
MSKLILFCSDCVKGENLFSYNVKIKLAFKNIIVYCTSQRSNNPSLSRLIAESEAGRQQVLEGIESLIHKSGRGKGNKRYIGR